MLSTIIHCLLFLQLASAETPFLRRLAKPACGDGTCRKSCSECAAEDQACSPACGGGGGDPPPPPPPSCGETGDSCKSGVLCCQGLTCASAPRGAKICEQAASSSPSHPPTNLPTSPPTTSSSPSITPPAQPYQNFYSGGTCTRNGPEPTESNTIVQFFAFGDAPYDTSAGAPLFMGDEYACLQNNILPNMLLDGDVDFVTHIGDIKKGSPDGNDPYCTPELFSSRRQLFGALEDGNLDFFLVVGDNEWNECAGYDENNNNDTAKELWREYFIAAPFASFDQTTLASRVASPTVHRDILYPENFFFTYSNIAFFGVTEPAGDSSYNLRNRDWLQTNLSGLNPAAIVIFGHANLSTVTKGMLSELYSNVPTIYIHGNGHPQQWCMQFDPSVGDYYLDMEVEAFIANPLKVSIVEQDGLYFFHTVEVEMGCSTA